MILKLLLILAALSAVFGDQGGKRLWTPQDGRTREEWMKCNGLPPDSCKRMPTKMKKLNELLGLNVKSEVKKQLETKSSAIEEQVNVIGDILLSEKDVEYLIQLIEHEHEPNKTRKRWKRALINFTISSYDRSWKSFMPIVYKFDGTHNSTEQDKIRQALQIWSSNTCVRFKEISMDTDYDKSHILFANEEWDTCNSYIGREDFDPPEPQVIRLGEGCLLKRNFPGFAVHEIGHALGFYHEQQRSDRNNYITIFPDNIGNGANDPNYLQYPTANVVPYHMSSIMHYSARSGQINSSVYAMQAKDPLYRQSMSNHVELTFDDAHAFNIAYECDSLCSSSPQVPCQRGGYRDPNNCAGCKCPKGFGGDFCGKVADPVNADCGGTLALGVTEQRTIKSPGYPGYKSQSHECSWLITCPPRYNVRLQFVGDFDFQRLHGGCGFDCTSHWVEVKFKSDLGLEGARFCCNSSLPSFIMSESHEMLINFNVDDIGDVYTEGSRIGFSANVMCDSTCACLNGGTCAFKPEGNLVCICPCGYSGRLCQIRDVAK